MAINKILTNSVADDAISEEHLDVTAITGNAELAESAAANDILLIYDTTAGVIKKILSSNVGVQGVTLTSISPTNVVSGDGSGNHTFTLAGTNFTGATATLINNSGTAVAFASVTVNSSTQITGVIAKSSLPNAGEPYDVKVTGTNNITAQLNNQINIDASPVFVTSSGSLGDVIASTAGSFSVNATDPESAGNVTFELQSGSLPPSYTITNTAAEGGTAIIAGTDSTTSSTTTFNFVLRAVDAASNTSSRAYSITSTVIQSTSFTSSGTFAVPSGTTVADVLVVAGGGGGGAPSPVGSAGMFAGGGGAGGLIFFPAYPVTQGTITVTVGNGGPRANANTGQPGTDGQNSVFGSPGDPGLGQGGILTSIGGGYGGPTSGNGGGSGAGGANSGSAHNGATAQQPTQPGNSGAYGFGSPGGNAGGPGPYGNGSAGGGGGAGSAGAGGRGGQGGAPNGGNGGSGRAYTIADGTTPVTYAGGGGGGSGQTPGQAREGTGGPGGGTPGSSPNPSTHPGTPGAGTANRGGGSGGANSGQGTGAGGKGVVIVRY